MIERNHSLGLASAVPTSSVLPHLDFLDNPDVEKLKTIDLWLRFLALPSTTPLLKMFKVLNSDA